jgi:hypothetical protein
MPAGLTFGPDGVLAGTPSESGYFEPVFRVHDGLSRTDEKLIGLTIQASSIPAVNVQSVVSRKNHAGYPDQDVAVNYPASVEICDVSSEPREGGVTELRITFDGVPGLPGDCLTDACLALESQTGAPCGLEADFAPYAGAGSVAVDGIDGNTLVLLLSNFEDGATYKFTVGGDVTAIAGQAIEVRMLLGDCVGTPVESYGQVEVADKTLLFANWGAYTMDVDFNLDGVVDVADKTLLFARWGSSAP